MYLTRTIFVTTLSLAISLAPQVIAEELSTKELSSISISLIELCRGGTREGKYKSYDITGSGEAKVVVLKGLIEAGLDGKLKFEKGEWDGIKALAFKDPTQEAHNACINANTQLFIDAVKESKKNKGGDAVIQGNGCGVATSGGTSSNNKIEC